MSYLIVIPARLESTRLPRKLLLSETGRPLLAHTIEAARASNADADVWVACDDESLAAAARAAGAKAVVVTEECESGTARIWRALPKLPPAEVVVNLQADEPQMPGKWIADCAAALLDDPAADVATIAVPLGEDDPAVSDPNRVKVVTDHAGYALYFSRSPIPYLRQGGVSPSPRALGHLGLYAYRAGFLKRYGELPPSPLEDAERLEQLRFLQAGAKIKVVVAENDGFHVQGIDTEEDYRAFVARWKAGRR
jgi:3-deoxy-manno-octulosonate cytidylyltransferase (CMP-KDO synthetase)